MKNNHRNLRWLKIASVTGYCRQNISYGNSLQARAESKSIVQAQPSPNSLAYRILVSANTKPQAGGRFCFCNEQTDNLWAVEVCHNFFLWEILKIFNFKSWLTSRHVCGHMKRVTCILRVPRDRPWVVVTAKFIETILYCGKFKFLRFHWSRAWCTQGWSGGCKTRLTPPCLTCPSWSARDDDISPETLQRFNTAFSNHGYDPEEFCSLDNSQCR